MTTPDTISTAYCALAFDIERHFPGFIDAYFGPPALRQETLAAPEPTLDQLRERADQLAAAIVSADLPKQRRDYLALQTRAMQTVGRKLAGDSLPYVEEVEGCFDITPEFTPESTFETAIDELDRLLPGEGAVGERMAAWRHRFVVPETTARAMIADILAETRRRTAALADLPAGESVEIAFVRDKPWSGYNWYLGDARSRVEINTDLPIHAHELVGLIAHEAYPGHHTEHSLKDRHLYHGLGYGEMAIQLINTPECVVHEGIATLAESIIFPADEGAVWRAETLYPAYGIESDPKRERAIADAQAELRAVGGNAALMRHVDGATEEETVAYLVRYGLRTEEEARQRFRFIDDPLWRPYIFTYHVGRDLVRAWLHASPEETRPAMFRKLLNEQLTPSSLRADLAA